MDNDEVDLWATDEVHFQQHGSRCRMWVPPETKDPVLLHHPTRRSVGYFGAVRLRDGKFRFSRETGKFNAMTFFAFLQMLRRTSIRSGRSVVVITDNAGYRRMSATKCGSAETLRFAQDNNGRSSLKSRRFRREKAGRAGSPPEHFACPRTPENDAPTLRLEAAGVATDPPRPRRCAFRRSR